MANVKITDLTALSGALAGADLFEMVDDVAGTPASRKVTAAVVRDFTSMAQATGTDANTTMAINTLYVVDMSAWATADRTYTLPATAAVGDRIGIMVTAGDASHELIITAGTGDTLNGISGGTEWSRLFITNEVVIMRCVVANATWIVEYDGRIACNGSITRTTVQAMGSGAFNKVNVATSEISVGGIVNTSSSRIDVRRAGNYTVGGFARLDLVTGKSLVVGIGLNGTVVARGQGMSSAAVGTIGVAGLVPLVAAAGDYFELYIYHDKGANADTATVSDSVPRLFAKEELK